jgi:hypothetical protein
MSGQKLTKACVVLIALTCRLQMNMRLIKKIDGIFSEAIASLVSMVGTALSKTSLVFDQ